MLRFLRLQVVLEALENIELPPFAGSSLRGDLLRFSLRLWGQGPRQLPQLIKALENLESEGVGKGRRSLRLLRIIDESSKKTIYADGCLNLTELQSQTLDFNIKKEQAIPSLRISFLTPLQLQWRGKLLKQLDFGELIYAAADRLWVIAHGNHAPQLAPDARALAQTARQAKIELIDDQSAYMSFSRFSHRQHQRHELGGIAGSMVCTDELNEFLPLLEAATFHLGKGTSLGLGAIKLEIQTSQ